MQLAFNHNQRTLEFGLQMADTLRAGVQVLAETQADCMKALVGSRSLFRNAHVPQLPSPPIEKIEEPPYDEDEDEDDDASKDWLQQLQPVVGVVVQQIMGDHESSELAGANSDAKREGADRRRARLATGRKAQGVRARRTAAHTRGAREVSASQT